MAPLQSTGTWGYVWGQWGWLPNWSKVTCLCAVCPPTQAHLSLYAPKGRVRTLGVSGPPEASESPAEAGALGALPLPQGSSWPWVELCLARVLPTHTPG